jgi:lipopolysaccharide/colanic/teichoic acid biosynthesis glycosyltransferase
MMPRDTVSTEYLFEEQFIAEFGKPSFGFAIFKYTIDIITSLFLLPITIVVCALVLILNPFLNRGKLFYIQERVGRNKAVFRIYKLRTIQSGSDNTKNSTEKKSGITPLGKFMRDTHIDELPQIINILSGEMSLIGPRPERPKLFQNYAQNIQGFTCRQSVRPGISGLAQIRYGYTECLIGAKHKLKWDLEYIRHQGFTLEIKIYLRTLIYIVFRIGKRLIGLAKSNRIA